MDQQHIFAVSEVNGLIKDLIDGTPQLSGLYIRGELSNYKIYPSGHHYFTLKDGQSALRCVMFKSSAVKLRFRPENGMQAVVFGRISVFPRDGAYQLYCTQLSPDGVGDLYVAFEQLKQKLQQEGLFDPAHKKPLPPYPQRIAIVTSGAGAAVHDMIRILRRRYPIAKVLLLPVRVQGAEAPPEIVGAIRYANRWKLGDVLITGRGGGSMEDLWAFNDERVARAIYASEIPVISAVGHEPDVTISDYVADRRASTPSNAAEIAVPDMAELLRYLRGADNAMAQSVLHRLEREERLILGAVTGKSRRGLDLIRGTHGFEKTFFVSRTADDCPSKPHPAMVTECCGDAGVDAARTVVIGDAIYDMQMAKAAGAQAIGVSWGYGEARALAAAGADAVVHEVAHILHHI